MKAAVINRFGPLSVLDVRAIDFPLAISALGDIRAAHERSETRHTRSKIIVRVKD